MTNFTILYQENEDLFELECSTCGEVFLCDFFRGINVDMMTTDRACCPQCGEIDEGF